MWNPIKWDGGKFGFPSETGAGQKIGIVPD